MDSAPGITATLAYTFEQLGLPIPTPAELVAYVGPPIMDSFRDLAGFDLPLAHRALEIYRAKYITSGVFDATVYPGIEDVFREIHERRVPLSLATSKPEKPAKLILERDRLAALLRRHHRCVRRRGAQRQEGCRQGGTRAARGVRRRHLAPRHGGRPHHDVVGAAEHDVPTIFVRWGYGSPAEEVGTIGVATTAAELSALLFPTESD